MRYFPILQELFESDTIVFLIIGVALGFGIGFKLKTAKSRICAVITCTLTYAVCEGISNIHTNFMAELFMLFLGTASLGAIAGMLLNIPVCRLIAKNNT